MKTRAGAQPPRDFGANLMEDTFHPVTGPLTDQTASPSAKNGRQRLFMGAMAEFRNATGHGQGQPIITDPLVAIEQIMFASALLRILR